MTAPVTAPPPRDADATPLPLAPWVPGLHVAPLTLFDRLRNGTPPLLIDRRCGARHRRLRGVVRWPVARRPETDLDWPFGPAEALLIDDDGVEATRCARWLRHRDHPAVQVLYGGLRLYAFTLHATVPVAERFLIDSAPVATL